MRFAVGDLRAAAGIIQRGKSVFTIGGEGAPLTLAGLAGNSRGRSLLAVDLALLIAVADLGVQGVTAHQLVHGFGDVLVHHQPVALLDLDQHVEGGRGAPFEHGLLRAAAAGFFIGKGDRFDAADQVGKGGVEQQVFEGAPVGGGDQLHAALGDGAGGEGFQLAPDLIDDDHLGVVVFNRLDHHLVLQGGGAHLHAAGASHGGMGHVAIAADLVGGIHDDHALALGEDARGFAQHGGLANAGFAEQEQALAGFDQVLDDIDGAVDGATHAAGEPDDMPAAVADGGDAVQGALQAGAVIGIEFADAGNDVVDLLVGDLFFGEDDLAIHEERHRDAAEIEDDLEEIIGIIGAGDGFSEDRRQDAEQRLQVVGDVFLGHIG